MTVACKNHKHILLAAKLATFILIATVPHITTTLVNAELTPPNTLDWLGTEETTGIFASGVVFNITSGLQFKPTLPQIRCRSNTSEIIKLGICIADFRLIRVDENGTLTETDFARFTISSIDSRSGLFWASMITDYPAEYRVGVVIWNASNGLTVGRLIRTIQASGESIVNITSDKAEFGPSEVISFTIVNHGPTVNIDRQYIVYRDVNGTWLYAGLNPLPLGGKGSWTGWWTFEHNETFKFSIDRAGIDFSKSGLYLIVVGGIRVLSTVFRVVGSGVITPIPITPEVTPGVTMPKVMTPNNELVRIAWMLAGASIGAIFGLVVFIYSKRHAHE